MNESRLRYDIIVLNFQLQPNVCQPTARSRTMRSRTCACGKGGPEPDLAYFAWHCEAAVALRAKIRAHLPARPTLTRADLFMLKPPHELSHGH